MWPAALFLLIVSNLAEASEDVCGLPKDAGSCRGRKVFLFYFNIQTRRCEVFIYGGCQGNANRFTTLEACHETCQHHLDDLEEVDVSVHLRGSHCLEPPINDEGRACFGYFPRYTFNPDTLQCEPYIYGGCMCTSNLYLSLDECMTSCLFGGVTSRLANSDSVKVANPKSKKKKLKLRGRTRDEEDDEEDYADEAHHADVSGANLEIALSPTLKSEEYGEHDDVCSLPPVHPHLFACLAFSEKWTFDSRQRTCIEYVYGGCFGTKNLFDSKELCETTCSNKSSLQAAKTIEVCGMPIVPGPCRAHKPKYGFDQNTNRCEKFVYGGCQGNDNRFDTLEECVNTCGGQEPEESLSCVGAVCNKRSTALYRAKGCLPVVRPGECCPSSWDCSAWEERLRRWDECFVANDKFPRGKFYSIGDNVPEAIDEGVCRMACRCAEGGDEEAEIICAVADCWLPGQQQQSRNCIQLYQDKQACCPTEVKCGSELSVLPSCTLDNVTYVAGQKMYPKADPCKICLCSESWNGDLENSQFCYSQDCGLNIHYAQKLKQGCVPVYKEGVCCPIDWVCISSMESSPEEVGLMVPSAEDCPEGVASRLSPSALPMAVPTVPLGRSSTNESQLVAVRPVSDVCLLPRLLGSCESFKEAWYFDMKTRRCATFQTGSLGNEEGNVFKTELDCKETCSIYMVESVECQIPVVTQCTTEDVRYRFNVRSGKCEDFYSSDCKGFRTVDECEARCVARRKITQELETLGKAEECNLPVVVGPCRSRLLRYYYDKETGLCKKFYFGGCFGNGNNFYDATGCLEKCVTDAKLPRALFVQSLSIKSPCNQAPSYAGPCRASIPRYTFYPDSRVCRPFFYGGCLGNDNNFASVSACSAACPVDQEAQKSLWRKCTLMLDKGNCKGMISRFYFDAETSRCHSFFFGGCGGNENNFQTESECRLECELPKLLQSLTLNKTARSKPPVFITSSFNTASQDEDESQDEDIAGDDPCLMDRKVGMCRASIKRYYFDAVTKDCKKFFYGGCGGNNNNFATLKQCQQRCAQHMADQEALGIRKLATKAESRSYGSLPTNPICSLPVETGPCRALVPSYFFNTQTKSCERFVYGGCRGNDNRFASLDDCESTCTKTQRKQTKPTSVDPLVIYPKEAPKCVFKGSHFNIGDLLRFTDNRCRICQCLSPPDLSCLDIECGKQPTFYPNGNSVCTPVYDDNMCCLLRYDCKPKPDAPVDCGQRVCVMDFFIAPPDHTCQNIFDGCCDAGMLCTPQ